MPYSGRLLRCRFPGEVDPKRRGAWADEGATNRSVWPWEPARLPVPATQTPSPRTLPALRSRVGGNRPYPRPNVPLRSAKRVAEPDADLQPSVEAHMSTGRSLPGIPAGRITLASSATGAEAPLPSDLSVMHPKGRESPKWVQPETAGCLSAEKAIQETTPRMAVPDDGGGDFEPEAVAELRRLARSRPRSGRQAVAEGQRPADVGAARPGEASGAADAGRLVSARVRPPVL
jgi:hypothetical protein